MDVYMSALFNMRKSRGARGALVLGAKDGFTTETNSRLLNIDDDRAVRRVISQISRGDFAHLPSLPSLKALLNSSRHRSLLRRTYNTLHLWHVSIDEVTARVLSTVLLSLECRCRNLQLHRSSFTDTGRKILLSALSMMAVPPLVPLPAADTRQLIQGVTVDDASAIDTHKQLTPCSDKNSPTGQADKEDSTAAGLRSLELCQMGLTDQKCAWVSSVIEPQPHLQSLSLCNNVIGYTGLRRLVAALSRSQCSLLVLDLSGNMLRSQGVQVLAEYLAVHGRHLECLDLSSNEITLAGAQELARVLRPEFGVSLKNLNLDMNRFEVSGCEELGQMLSVNKTLETLTLSQNNIFNGGCRLLFDGLASNSNLRVLDIGGNFITHVGVRSIRDYLLARDGSQMGLRTLNLSTNPLGDEGVGVLCRGLQSDCRLANLVIDNVDVTDRGARVIRQLLEFESASLLTISLRHNAQLSHIGFAELALGCKHNRNVLRLIADPQFVGWDVVWTKVEMALIRNTVYAIDRCTVPLLMVARGRILLHSYTHGAGTWLPVELRRMILNNLDRYQVLTPEQRTQALKIACNPSRSFGTRLELLEAVTGNDYPSIVETMQVINP